jgi:enoyl-[acyl-carrier protein] reductase I
MSFGFGITRMLKNKVGLILGIANERSVAYAIGKLFTENEAHCILTYPSDVIKKRVQKACQDFGGCTTFECDVSNHDSIAKLFSYIKSEYGKLDFIVHSVAFSDKEELKGKYIDTSLDNFLNAMHISCYSLTAIAKHALPLMKEDGGSIITLSYYGAKKVIPHYNVMGPCKAALEASVKYLAVDTGAYNIRVNAISSGPIKTLAASAIDRFSCILKWNKYNSPLKHNTTTQEVAKCALYLASDLSSGTTGQTIYVDSGYNIVGMCATDLPDGMVNL